MRSTTFLIVAGALALIGGLVALIFPLPASLAVTVFVGWSLIVIGALSLYAAFSDSEMPSRWWSALFGLLELAAGVWVIANPLKGMVSLTLMVGALFFASGASRIFMGLGSYRGTRLFWMMIISGLISAALGLYILFTLPEASLILLGTLLAIELLIIGATLLTLGIAINRNGKS